MKALWIGLFAAGALLFWTAPLSAFASRRRLGVRELIGRYWRQASLLTEDGLPEALLPETRPEERLYLEKARLAGVQWSYRSYVWGRRGGALAGCYLWLMAALPDAAASGLPGVLRAIAGAGFAAAGCWMLPPLTLALLAARRREKVLAEISKFAHRMSICLAEQNDLRELILRAGRPLRILRPHLQRLAAQWGNDQGEAILAFRDAVGISEAYPLVNAFTALSRAKPADIKRLLEEHARGIDATLDAEMAKKIENAPVWISFYIMIPFLVCLALFIYPWLATVLEQLSFSFSV